jgi:hypothetical protein
MEGASNLSTKNILVDKPGSVEGCRHINLKVLKMIIFIKIRFR